MKYCVKCGASLLDEAVICVKCGCATSDINNFGNEHGDKNGSSSLKTAALILMIISTAISAFYVLMLFFVGFVFGETALLIAGFLFAIPFLWQIPLIIKCGQANKNRESIGIGIKVCVLLLVNVIAGILLLCEEN